MKRLIDDLLDVSRIVQGRIQVERRLCDLVAIVRATAADHALAFERSDVRLRVELPDRPLWVMGDRTRLAQVVTNLLSNANKFTPPAGTVTVRLAELPAGEEALLTVADTGVGMEPEILAHVFEPFTQADRTIDRSRGGLGLGLAVVKGLVEIHGGTVHAASAGSGRGATFTLRFPLSPAVLQPRERPESAHDAGRPRRILVVEDNKMAARSLQMFLVEQRHEVAVAHSGRAGIELARRFRPEVVLCDIGLPESDGYTLARTLKRERGMEGVHWIAVTGYGLESDRRKAREAGFDRHLTKPVDLDELHAILTELPTRAAPESDPSRA